MGQRITDRMPVTRAGWSLIALGAVSYLTGWAFGWIELMVLTAGCLLGLLLATPFVIGRHRLDVVRSIEPERVTVGEPAIANLRVSNPTKAPIRGRVVEDRIDGAPVAMDVSGLMPGASTDIVHTLPTSSRGVVHVGPAVVAKADPLGLMRREVSQAEANVLWVHPKIVSVNVIPAGFAKDLEGPTSDTSPAGDVSFHALRDYEVGDDHRHVHWLSTARTGSLMVRHYVDNRLPHLTVILDREVVAFGGNAFETAVEIAGSLTIGTMLNRQPIALHAGSEQVIGSAVRRSTDDVLDQLTLVEPADGENLGAAVDRALTGEPDTSALVIVTGPRPADALLDLTQRISRQAHPFVVRVWPDDEIQPVALPSATVFDVASVETFQSSWNRAIR